MTTETLPLSRQRLQTFLICQRRFQLRYLRRLPWPDAPMDERSAAALTRGQQFHELAQRHFLGLSVDMAQIDDATLRRWWTLFQNSNLPLPPGDRLVEMNLTVPMDDHLLTGRFDLVVIGENKAKRPFAHVFDWKTGTPQDETVLRRDWQTRLYLAMLVEGGAALWRDDRPAQLLAEDVAITYWYVQEPDAPRTIDYTAVAHADNWEEITAVVADIEAELERDAWPLTSDWSHCRVCAYQVYCGRQAAGQAVATVDEDDILEEDADLLVPERP